jgi:hypothetical protein
MNVHTIPAVCVLVAWMGDDEKCKKKEGIKGMNDCEIEN